MKGIFSIVVSGMYRVCLALRHLLFDQRILPSFSVNIPTICVGNLALGGTGKTPMTAYIVQLLLDHGYHPAVLSRGYKRKTYGFVLADGHSTTETLGDEMMQLHRAFPEVPLAVCADRVRGVNLLTKMVKNLDVVVLDDAFQHRSIRCGWNVLLTPYDRLYIDDHVIPWGKLRDLPSRALKADAVVVTKCPDTIRPIDMRVVENRLHMPPYQSLHFAKIAYAEMEQKGTPLVVTGIAQPHYLMEHIKERYPQAQLMAYPDHHAFSRRDIESILSAVVPFDFVLTTEKDLQRLRSTDLRERLEAQGKRLIALPIRTVFCTPQENFDRQILNYVHENRHR